MGGILACFAACPEDYFSPKLEILRSLTGLLIFPSGLEHWHTNIVNALIMLATELPHLIIRLLKINSQYMELLRAICFS